MFAGTNRNKVRQQIAIKGLSGKLHGAKAGTPMPTPTPAEAPPPPGHLADDKHAGGGAWGLTSQPGWRPPLLLLLLHLLLLLGQRALHTHPAWQVWSRLAAADDDVVPSFHCFRFRV